MSGRVTVDPDVCTGSEECVRIASAAFAIDEERGVSVPQPGADTTPLETLLDAARNCPTNAIEVRGADGTVLFESAR